MMFCRHAVIPFFVFFFFYLLSFLLLLVHVVYSSSSSSIESVTCEYVKDAFSSSSSSFSFFLKSKAL